MSKLRVLLVGDYPRDRRLGSPKVMLKLQAALQRLGHSCDTLFEEDLGRFPRNSYLRQAFAPLLALGAVRRRVREHGPYDIIDVASAEGLWIGVSHRLGAFRDTAVISRLNGLEHLNYRRMIGDHDAGLRPKPWTRRWFHPAVRLSQVAGAARVADRLILQTDVDREFALSRRWQSSDDIDMVSLGVSEQFLESAPWRNHPRGHGVLFCGTWIEQKGVTYLAQAFSSMVDRGCHANLTILGGAVPDEQILSGFSPAARAQVTLMERVDEHHVIDAYRTHDVFVLPSTYEGFGMVVLEAMSQRLPVVATPVGGAKTLVVDGETGLQVPLRDPRALGDAILRLLDDPKLRLTLADAAYERVHGMTWAATAQRTVRAYASALERVRRRHRTSDREEAAR